MENFASVYRSSKGLSSTKVDAQSVVNWTVVGQLTAKFHYKGPTGPDRTEPDQTNSADFVGDPHGPSLVGPV